MRFTYQVYAVGSLPVVMYSLGSPVLYPDLSGKAPDIYTTHDMLVKAAKVAKDTDKQRKIKVTKKFFK